MSALSTSPSPSSTGEDDSSDDNTFRRSMPRLSNDVATALRESVVQMVAHQVATAPPTGPNAKTPLDPVSGSQRKRAPQCTHIAMTRLYGQYACMICGKVPALGWVYQCEQDHLQQLREFGQSIEALPLLPDHGNFFEAQAEIARSLGMNHSIISQMRAGEYSYEQIDILLSQRRKVKEVIKEAQRSPLKKLPKSNKSLMSKLIASSRSDMHNPLVATSSIQPSAQTTSPTLVATTSPDTPIESTSIEVKKVPKKPMCNFQVCHSCRPYFKDRVPASFEAMFSDEISPGTTDQILQLPIHSAHHLRNIGLHQETSITKAGHAQHELENESEEVSEDSMPTSSSSKISHEPNYVEPYPCPGILICPLYTPSAGCAYDQGFDDGNRAINHGFVVQSTEDPTLVPSTTPDDSTHTQSGLANSMGASPSNTSSISLPDPVTEPLTPSKWPAGSHIDLGGLKPRTFERSASQPGYAFPAFDLRGKTSDSSLGSEIEVDGGVALTEQAIQLGVPDILTDSE